MFEGTGSGTFNTITNYASAAIVPCKETLATCGWIIFVVLCIVILGMTSNKERTSSAR